MTVALALKPNSGSVFARVTLRAIGTVLGVLLAAGVLAVAPSGWWTAVFLLAMAAALPEALSRHYGLFTAAVTSVVLVLVSGTHLFPQQIPAERLLNSLLGCGIALVVGHLLWPERGPALPRRIADAVETVSDYLHLSLPGSLPGSWADHADERSPLRRRAYRELSDLRAALQQQLLEPGSTQDAEQWWTSVILLERVLDAATERVVLVGQRDDDQLQEAQRAVSEMRTTARRLRSSEDVAPGDLRARLDDVYSWISG